MKYSAMLILGLLSTTACGLFDNALEVQNPSTVPASILEVPANAQLLVNGAIADFECAAGSYAVMGGLITDELLDATQTADRFPYDRRTMASSDRRYAVNTCIALGVYSPLQTARFSTLNVLSLLQGWTTAQVPGRDTLIATLQAYEGYSLVMLGEGFCTMVISTLDANRQTVFGGEIQRDSVFKLAVATFSNAITSATATGQTGVLNMALVGRARAYVGLGLLAAAKTDAQLVTPAFAKLVTASSINSRRNNRVWQENSVTSTNTSLGAPYITMTDPRVPFVFRRPDSVSVTGVPLYEQLKYQSASSAIRLASGDEARLIIAEADLAVADFAGADSIISNFRARGGDTAITSVDSATVAAALYDQRRREFFLEGQHLGDAIRFKAALNPPAGTAYPGGGTYGTQVCLPLPDVEKQNNPNFP
jgi:starch-binding outer membrane protein, SusD/RagB family